MKWQVVTTKPVEVKCDILVVPVAPGDKKVGRRFKLASPELARAIDRGVRNFDAKTAAVRLLDTLATIPAASVLLVGIGDDGDERQRWRRIGSASCREAKKLKAKSLAFVFDAADIANLDALVEGVLLDTYRFDLHKKADTPDSLETLSIVTDSRKGILQAIKFGTAQAKGTMIARDLSNLPGGEGSPAIFVREARKHLRASGVKMKVLDEGAIQREKMNLLLAVARGSQHEARLLVMEYGGGVKASKSKPLVIIGKGVTFDTGGVALKPGSGMLGMQHDKSGAAAVVGAMSIIAALKVNRRVIALAPLAENAIGSKAVLLGDIVTAANGMTVEIRNSDAEGRLILADALHYATRFKPAAVIDIATLTGACVVGLGTHAAGMFTEDDELRDSLVAAGAHTFERVWPMPLWDEYADEMKGNVSDLSNIADSKTGGACTAAGFLRNFRPEGVTWGHIDMAGQASVTSDKPFTPRGATGYGARLLARWVMEF